MNEDSSYVEVVIRDCIELADCAHRQTGCAETCGCTDCDLRETVHRLPAALAAHDEWVRADERLAGMSGHEHRAVRPDETTDCRTCVLLGGAAWGESHLIVGPRGPRAYDVCDDHPSCACSMIRLAVLRPNPSEAGA